MTKKFKHHAANQSCLYRVRGLNKLADALLVPIDFIEDLSALGNELYTEKEKPKNQTESRLIEDPHMTLKGVQTRIARILGKITPPRYLFSPVKKRSAIMNAAYHRGAKAVWTVDVRKYFPRTTPKKVYKFFHEKMECSQDIALLLTNLTTRYDHLPTGAPTSPILAFYANKEMWDEIAVYCEEQNLKFSLYMDDLTISGERVSKEVKNNILAIIRKNNFIAHKQKYNFLTPARVTGPMVIEDKIDAPNKHYKKMRLLKKRIKSSTSTQEKEELQASLKGLREYTRQIRLV